MHPISLPCLAWRFLMEVYSLLYRASRYITFQKYVHQGVHTFNAAVACAPSSYVLVSSH
ncbi:hypothetical protein BDV35DRAFT_365251 [Aspergillus flavus]|uniref:Uncharacterized protein n=1 Tax=Aspergillus flavus TaxID=5059 RepID=A0A5N6GK23_ASPFL|nr:hypothetical protein BDV35DRAFT_365251 [Aspergillus flavus]